uniref:Reverse transcriptase Ty1/copia-type domain-containing protein n=1 Tax=Physcomitrium patens TaxID=3218 RepID=A0A2K1KL97_PHYPA|nr:hypothetical protein PHYPA_008227 [Physcomitrium patens]
MSDLGNITYYLGVGFIQQPEGIFLFQQAYASHILTEFDMQDCTLSTESMAEGLKLSKDESASLVDAKKFQKLIGMLIYLVNTKPEIFFATGVLSKFMQSSRVSHLHAANQILRYVKGALNLGIFYKHSKSPTMLGFTDSD